MEVGVFVAMMMGTIPAILLRFYMLRPFEGMFEERSVMLAFAIGMVAGVVAGVFHVFVDGYLFASLATAIALFVIGWAIVDQFLRVIIFNSPRFSGDPDTTFYSTTFGLGYGAMLTALWFYRSFVLLDVGTNPWVLASYVGAAFAFAVVHGATGMLVGFGAAEGELWRFGFLGVLVQLPLNVMWWLALASSVEAAVPIWELGTITMFIAAAYGVYILRWTMGKVVPDLLPKEAMRRRRRDVRRQRRSRRESARKSPVTVIEADEAAEPTKRAD